MRNALHTLLLTATFATSLTFAQSAPTRRTPPTATDMAAHRVAALTQALTLTDAQQAQANTIFTGMATTEAANRAGMKTLHQQLSDAIKTGNNGGIETTATALAAAERQSIVSNAKAQSAFYQILTAEQKAKFDTMHSFGGPGPRGFGGPGMQGMARQHGNARKAAPQQ